LTANWWQARARGTDLSRKAQAIRLYRQHFEASCQLAFAQGTLNAEQLNMLLDLVTPAVQTSSPEILVYVETLSLRGDSGLTDELPGPWPLPAIPTNRSPSCCICRLGKCPG
jgi:hypothetical protein